MMHCQRMIKFIIFCCVLPTTTILGARLGKGGESSPEVQVQRRVEELYTVTSNLDWTIFVSNPRILSTSEVYKFESRSSNYIKNNIIKSSDGAFEDQTIFNTHFTIQNQNIDYDNVKYSLKADLSMMYSGKVLEDDIFSKTLTTAVTEEKIDELLLELGDLLPFANSAKITFNDKSPSVRLGSTKDSKRNETLFISLLIVSCLLAMSSFFIIYTSGFCSCLCRRRNNDAIPSSDLVIKSAGTEESDDENNLRSPQRLGANTQSAPGGFHEAITPQRGIYNEYDTPESQRTFHSNASSATSVDTKRRLGITAKATLKKNMFSPAEEKKEKGIYDEIGMD